MEKWQMIPPYPGAHIRVQMPGYYHHGIYIGQDEVIQFGEPTNVHSDPQTVKVLQSPIQDFLKGGFLEVRIYTKKEQKTKRSPEEIIAIAKSKIGEGGYSFIHNNCEHFANYCVFGKKISHQIDDVHQEIKKILNK